MHTYYAHIQPESTNFQVNRNQQCKGKGALSNKTSMVGVKYKLESFGYQTCACLRWRQPGANDKKCPPRLDPLRESYNFLGRSGRSSYPVVSQSPQCIGMRLFNVSIKLEEE